MVLVFDNDAVTAFAKQFEHHAFRLFRQEEVPDSPDATHHLYRAWCGCSSSVSAMVWILLVQEFNDCLPKHASMERMIWALHLLSKFDSERSNASLFGVDDVTYRRWAWWFITKISSLETSVVRLLLCLV